MDRRTISIMAEWWSIEVLHGEFSAFRWQEQHDSALIQAALTNGAVDGSWHADRWGVVFEICFENEERWETFRSLPAWYVRPWTACQILSTACSSTAAGAAEQVPGSRANRSRRRALSAVSLPEPQAAPHLDLTGISPLDPVSVGTAGGSGL